MREIETSRRRLEDEVIRTLADLGYLDAVAAQPEPAADVARGVGRRTTTPVLAVGAAAVPLAVRAGGRLGRRATRVHADPARRRRRTLVDAFARRRSAPSRGSGKVKKPVEEDVIDSPGCSTTAPCS